MITLGALTDLYRHMEWADAAVWTSVLNSTSASTDPKLREYFYHVHLVQRAFLRTWVGEHTETSFPTFDDKRSLMLWARSYYPEALTHLGTLSDQNLLGPMVMPWAGMIVQVLGRPAELTTLGETVLQVALHSTYHRGQINARLRELGGEPSNVDYIAWLWLGRPRPSWPKS